ncbi:MAG: Zn-ribbon domain-containing OB-fold protein [Dehalococcoidia bacterium]
MRKQSPVPNDLDRPFYDACNEDRLVLQHCAACNRFQFPPRAMCPRCGNPALTWQQVSGRGRIQSRVVVYDSPVSTLIPDQPFNVATISLEEEPQLTMLSHLPGVPVDKVPIGAAVEVIFETTPATGQKVPEWRVVEQ